MITRRTRYLLQKEFIQIFRNRFMVPILFVMPVVQLIILSYAANFEVKNIRIAIVDHSNSLQSRNLKRHFDASENFYLTHSLFSVKKAKKYLDNGSTDLILVIPGDFSKNLQSIKKRPGLQLIIDAINGSKAGIAAGYCTQIIQRFNKDIIKEISMIRAGKKEPHRVEVKSINWFNPRLDYKAFMVPGILALLVTMIGLFLSSINIVREKEMGTIEQINVTPIKKYEFITGKLLPFWILGLMEMSLGLLFAVPVFQIPLEGSLALVFLFSALYLWVVLGIGMLISTFTKTQQQAMFISWFIMVIFILMSGLFTPIESMPEWAKVITWFNPVGYMVELMRMVMLKGSHFADISGILLVLLIFALATNTLAVLNHRKTGG